MCVFKAYDIRGIYGKDLTNKTALKIGKALGTFLRGREEVCVGFDTRKGSKKLQKVFALALPLLAATLLF
jgi:phosphomannomutase